MAVERFEERIVDEHIDELRFLLHLRAHRLPLARGDVREWLDFDRRLASHIDGLLLRAPRAWAKLEPALRKRPTPAALRLIGVLALNANDESLIDRWLVLASAHGGLAAAEVVRWVLPARISPLLALLIDDGLAGDLRLALALELSVLEPQPAGVWPGLAERLMSHSSALPLASRAVARLGTAAGDALSLLGGHRQPAMRVAAAIARPADATTQPTLHEASHYGAAATMRVALRLPQAALDDQLNALLAHGDRKTCACAAAARGLLQWFEPGAALVVAGKDDDDEAVALLAEALRGHSGSTAACLAVLRRGECVSRLLAAETLRARVEGFEPPDLLAPMWQQLSHPALSTPASTAPAA